MLDSVVLRAMPLAVLVALAAGPAGAADGEKVFHEGGADPAALPASPATGRRPRASAPQDFLRWRARRLPTWQSRSRIFEVAPA